jgi:amino acid transporter
VAIRNAVGLLGGGTDVPESFWYSVKRRLLGPPMVNEQLHNERLSRPLALGVLSCDGISSAAYGTEEILIEMLPVVGVAAFTLVLPMTLLVLAGIVLVVLSYREVVAVYTRAGGSYVVARENFGPRVAQVAAVALLIDYVVTVAVQTAAGSAAIVSAFPQLATVGGLSPKTVLLIISLAAVAIMCYGNLRGIREAGKTFALPTYLFSGAVGLMIVVGLVREVTGGVPHVHSYAGTPIPLGHNTSSLLTFAMIYMLARAFANGGSSLTGIEAVSNAVSALRPPEGRNAREILVTQGSIVAFLIAGISWFAHITHARPYDAGVPTVLAQEADVIFGQPAHFMFYVVQAATAFILFTGGNTSFSGFPFLASFVAEDSFLPRWLSKRGHRLVFSNGIIVLTVVSAALLIVFGATVNALVPLYAIGVFTGFAMAGFGMARYHRRTREQAWRRRRVINMVGGIYTAIVVAIFAVVKFSEGAWVIVILFPVLVFAFIRLNREYAMESRVLDRVGGRPKPPAPPNYPHRTVLLFVDSFDLATLAALRYARSLRPTALRAVHFVIDSAQADTLREEWTRADRGVVLDFIDCPDRRLARAATDLVSAEAAQPGKQVTVVLPRRSYSPLLGRLLHDRTADKIAGAVSRIPHSAATIIPFDVRSRIEVLHDRHIGGADGQAAGDGKAAATGPAAEPGTDAGSRPEPPQAREPEPPQAPEPEPQGGAAAAAGSAGREDPPPAVSEPPSAALRGLLRRPGRGARDKDKAAGPSAGGQRPSYDRPAPSPGVNPIGSIQSPGRATVEGRVRTVEIRPVERNAVLACEISDSTGDLTALFYGRSHIPGIVCGARVRFRGPVGMRADGPVMINPAYELLSPAEPTHPGA